MTQILPETGTAFDTLQKQYDVYVPRFEAYIGPMVTRPAPDRTEAGLKTVREAVDAEISRLERLVTPSMGVAAQYVPLAGPVDGDTTTRTNDVRSITFTESVGGDASLATVELQLHNVYDARAQRYRYTDPPAGGGASDAPLIDYGRLVALRIGYRDKIAFVFEGVITTYSVSFPGEDASMVSVTATDRRDALRGVTPPELDSGHDQTEEAVLQKIVAKAGLFLARRDNQSTRVSGPVRLPRDGDVGMYIKTRAERVALELSAFGETVFALRPADNAETALRYRYREGLISFTPRFDATGIRTTVNVRFRGSTGALFSGQAEVGDLRDADLTPTVGENALLVVADRSGSDRVLNVTDMHVDSDDEAQELALALLKTELDRVFTAEGELMGDPRVRAGTSLQIDGVGRFSGLYYLTRVVHEYGESGYRTRFNARRNTQPSLPPQETGAA